MHTQPHQLARKRHPVTSKRAAIEVVREGLVDTQVDRVVRAVRRWPGNTATELAERAGLCRYMVGKRLSVAVERGLIRRGVKVQCTVTRRLALTWRPR